MDYEREQQRIRRLLECASEEDRFDGEPVVFDDVGYSDEEDQVELQNPIYWTTGFRARTPWSHPMYIVKTVTFSWSSCSETGSPINRILYLKTTKVMAFQIVVNKLKKLILFFFGLIKRSLCCFKRRRRSSCESIPLTGVGVGPLYAGDNNDVESWAWEEPAHTVSDPNSVQHHIEMYRSIRNQSDKEEEHQPNFFEDMAPKITKQTKVHLRPHTDEQENSVSSRLNFAPEAIPAVASELGSWEESEGQGSWEDAESWDAARLVREKRRAEREKHSSLKRDHNRSSLGSKVS